MKCNISKIKQIKKNSKLSEIKFKNKKSILFVNQVKNLNAYKDISLLKKWVNNYQTDLLIK